MTVTEEINGLQVELTKVPGGAKALFYLQCQPYSITIKGADFDALRKWVRGCIGIFGVDE